MTRHDIAARPIRVLVTGAGGPAAVSVLKSLRIAMVRFLEECFIELGEVRRVAA